ncbi:ABC transporter permease [Nocardioides sp.]|uniref:ABC transporter permease n=1 Tax=Nocardioides sp. TaxID=35761 RepID=UPI0031FEE59C
MTTTSPVITGRDLPGAAPGRRRRRSRGDRADRSRSSPLDYLRRWISPLVIVGVWQILSSTGALDERTLASPAQIATRTVELVQDGTLGTATLVSVQRVAIGFVIGASIGVAFAIAAGLSRFADDAIDPPMQMLRTLPHFGLIPLFIIWFGLGETPKLALIAMGVAFPLYLNTLGGIRGIDNKMVEAARSMNLSWGQRLRHVIMPGALPQTLVGLRQSLGIAWLTLIVAETISAHSGLGYMINHARDFLQIDVIVVGLAMYSLLGLLTDGVVRQLERRALVWRS